MKNSVVNYLVETTKRYSEKCAIIDSKGSYTFAELLSNACDLAYELKNKFINIPVGIYLPKSKEMIACYAGINMADCFYVPLDTKSPISRVLTILKVLESKLIITDSDHLEALKEYEGEIICIDKILRNEQDWKRAENIIKDSKTIDTDPVYSIFTSGSTGTPKGVVIPHRGVIDYIDWAVETFGITEQTVIGNQAPFYFDNSILDIYLMYATGATLNIIPEERFAFPTTLVDYLNKNNINFIFWVPFVLINIANLKIFKSRLPETLKDVFFCGEIMPNKQLNYWRSYLPDCRYVNLYGPTEITDACTYYVVNRKFEDYEPLPIGKPCKNTDILILRDRKYKCGINEQGEICVRGSSLALGYYNNSEKTQDAFINNPLVSSYPEKIYCTGDLGYWNERGEIMILGRADSQIKHKGYRIELGEIETAINGSDLVEECCVIYNSLKQRITLIYQNKMPITVGDLKLKLNERIPVYMHPSVLIKEELMKRNPNGKIDRAYYNSLVNG